MNDRPNHESLQQPSKDRPTPAEVIAREMDALWNQGGRYDRAGWTNDILTALADAGYGVRPEWQWKLKETLVELVDQRDRAVRALARVVKDWRVAEATYNVLNEPWAQEVLNDD